MPVLWTSWSELWTSDHDFRLPPVCQQHLNTQETENHSNNPKHRCFPLWGHPLWTSFCLPRAVSQQRSSQDIAQQSPTSSFVLGYILGPISHSVEERIYWVLDGSISCVRYHRHMLTYGACQHAEGQEENLPRLQCYIKTPNFLNWKVLSLKTKHNKSNKQTKTETNKKAEKKTGYKKS